MKSKFMKVITEIQDLLIERNIHIELKIITESQSIRIQLITDKKMKDRGLNWNNVVLDLVIDNDNGFIFFGLLRLPPEVRKEKLTYPIVQKLKQFAIEHSYTIFLDACDECEHFWRKHEFTKLHTTKTKFDIMGYSKEKNTLIDNWKKFKNTEIYKKFFYCHE